MKPNIEQKEKKISKNKKTPPKNSFGEHIAYGPYRCTIYVCSENENDTETYANQTYTSQTCKYCSNVIDV